MLEPLFAFLRMLPPIEPGDHVQSLCMRYNATVASYTGKYVYHHCSGRDYLYEEDLALSFNNFDWSRYWEGESDILQPQIEDRGFIVLEWGRGETDSCGPLTREALLEHCVTGEKVIFVYG